MKHKLIIVIMALMAGFFTSCTDVEFCPDSVDEHPHTATVSYGFDWSGLDKELRPGANQPDSMYVVAYRVINMWKSSVIVACKGDANKPSAGKYIRNAVEPVVTYPGQTKTDTIKQFKVKTGEYKFVCFNGSNSEIDYTDVDNYIYNDNIPLQSLSFSFKTYDKSSPDLVKIIPKWEGRTDLNDYAGYIQPEARAVYYDTLTVRQLLKNRNYHMKFRFNDKMRLTQRLTFKFHIKKLLSTVFENGDTNPHPFTVDSVFGEVSGIPYKVNLSNRYIDITKTAKMMWRANVTPDNDANEEVDCEAIIDVPTLVRNQQKNIYTGPGIIHLIIYCSSPIDPDDPNSERKVKHFPGNINLYNTLEKAKLYTTTLDKQNAYITKAKATLEIIDKIVLDGSNIIENSDNNEGLDQWKAIEERIIVDI